jgi:hypothetical protein
MGIWSGEGLRLYGFKQVMYFSLLDFGLSIDGNCVSQTKISSFET